MPTSDDRRLASEAVNRGLLSPGQANQALRALKQAESTGKPASLKDILVQNKIVSLNRWESFVQAVADGIPAGSQRTHAPKTFTPPPDPKKVLEEEEKPPPAELGGYRLQEKIGQGGMGSVYKAMQKAMRRVVAVKVLPKKLAEDPAFVERFRREARAAAALNHPNVVVPIDVGEIQGFHYLAMEYINGENLRDWMEREGRLKWRDAVEVTKQVALGLAHAHKLKMVHRDIKPDNILIDGPSNLAKIADLGLARRDTDDRSTSNKGDLLGTPYYISPEQARGDQDIDGRADIYSLGATLWHLLVGVPPFEGTSGAVIMTKHLTEAVPDPRTAVSDCPDDLVAVINKMMAKNRDDRYADCTQLAEDLERLLKGKAPNHAPPLKRTADGTLPLTIPASKPGPQVTRHRNPAGSRLRAPAGSRMHGPAASRMHSPAGSRLRDPSTSRVGSGHPRGRDKTGGPFRRAGGSPSSWIFALAAVLVVLTVVAAMLMRDAPRPPRPKAPDNAPAPTQGDRR